MKTRVLFVDDDEAMRGLMDMRLTNRGFSVKTAGSAGAALDAIAQGAFDAVVTDLNMQGATGLQLCRQVIEARPNLPVILVTAFGSLASAIEAIRAGAYDFLPKPFEFEQLVLAIERGATLARLEDEVVRLRKVVADVQSWGELVGGSPPMTELYRMLARIADSDVPVLVTGESGTGKELVARALHRQGPHARGPFVAVNCAAMPEALLESELFGHARGAFTDAKSSKEGLFVAANGGTIFLDEIGELPLALQPKLLRALQERKVRPVGAAAEVAFDARLITATNRDLEAMVEARTFREDLYFRINVIQVSLPPLRARGSDLMLLAQHFLARITARVNKPIVGFSASAAQRMVAYPWPGNVRELENSIERAVALAMEGEIAVADLPEKVRNHRSAQIILDGDDPMELLTLDEMERRYVTRIFDSVGGNKSAAARILNVERKTLHRMLQRWGVASE